MTVPERDACAFDYLDHRRFRDLVAGFIPGDDPEPLGEGFLGIHHSQLPAPPAPRPESAQPTVYVLWDWDYDPVQPDDMTLDSESAPAVSGYLTFDGRVQPGAPIDKLMAAFVMLRRYFQAASSAEMAFLAEHPSRSARPLGKWTRRLQSIRFMA